MPSDASAIRLALTTTGSLEEARRLARALVERSLAACVNLIPDLTSIYRWKGSVEETSEVLLLIKTTSDKLSALEAAVLALHSYDVPEFLVLGIESGNQPYVDWLLGSVE